MKNQKKTFTQVKEFESSIVAPVVQIKVAPNEWETLSREDVYLEFHVYDLNDNLIDSDYNVDNWRYDKNQDKISFNVLAQLQKMNFTSGRYKVRFRLYQNLVGSNEYKLYIHEIGSSKKELRVRPYSNNDQLISEFLDFFLVEKKDKFGRILQPHINLGQDRLFRIVNWQPDFLTFTDSPYSLVLKLKDELPSDITTEKDFLYITLPNSEQFEEVISIQPTNVEKNLNVLSNANFEAKAGRKQTKKEIDYHNWTSLVSTNENIETRILSKYFGTSLEGIELNIDFRDFSNFCFYSSAEKRLKNFRFKLEMLESYESSINQLYDISPVSASVTSSTEFVKNVEKYTNRKQNLIKSFDFYERYLYFESGSYYTGSYGEYDASTWPKSNSSKPYTLYSVTSSEAQAWYDGMIVSASYYDRVNDNALVKNVPEHIRIDKYSSDFEDFVDIIAQHFDILWLYVSHLEKIYEHKESLYEGIAKDLIYTLLQSYGWEPDEEYKYDDLWYWDLATDESGNYQVTSSYSVGEEVVYAVTESIPRGDISKETWKRIWNNLPYIHKTKGTKESIYALMSVYGVPRTLLDIREFGGPEKLNRKSYWISDKFTYALDLTGNDEAIVFPYRDLKYSDITPNSLEFRFKTVDGSNWGSLPSQYVSQSLIKSNDESVVFYLEHTIGQFGKIKMLVQGTSDYYAETDEGPFFDGNWWHFTYNHNQTNETIGAIHTFDIYALKSKYDEITHVHSASFTIDGGTYSTNLSNLFGSQDWFLGGEEFDNYTSFTGQIQELRMWAETLDYATIVNHALAPTSYTANDPTGSYDTLAFRLPLGTDLRKYDHSITLSLDNKCPNQITSTFKDDSFRSGSAINFGSGYDYSPIYETYSTEWPDISANRRISNKVRIDPNQLTGNLSPDTRVDSAHYDSWPNDSPKIGVYLSPTNEVDEDIAEQMGGFRIDDYIGEWDDIYRPKYRELEQLKRHYFKKYTSKYDVRDYLRLAKYFNNSLFKQIKNLLPARSNKIVGIVVEPHILNRSKIQMLANPPSADKNNPEGIIMISPETASGYVSYYSGSIQYNSNPVVTGLANQFTASVGMDGFGFLGGQMNISDFDYDTWSNQNAIQAFVYQTRTSEQKFVKTTWVYATASAYVGSITVQTDDASKTDWSNTANIRGVPNDNFGTALTNADQYTDTLFVYDFGFNVPQKAQISNVKVEMTRKKLESGATGVVQENSLKLKSGINVSENKKSTKSWGTTAAVGTYEGNDTYWKLNFDSTMINSSNFGVEFIGYTDFTSGLGTVGHAIDAIGITIEYYYPVYTSGSDVNYFLPAGMENSYWKGSKLIATDFNIPSEETPDGKPIIEFHITDANEVSVKRTDSEGNLDVK